MNAITPIIEATGLSSRALLVSLKISVWSAHKYDSTATAEVNSNHAASSDAGRYNKRLVPKESLDSINKLVSATRNEFNEKTLPWSNEGTRIVRADAYMSLASWLNKQKAEFECEVNTFLTDYPQHVAEAQRKLGSLFKAEDYPSASELAVKFGMSIDILPVPSGTDFRADVPPEQLARLRAEMEQVIGEATRTAVADVYRRVLQATERMAEKLTAYKPGTRNQKAENIFRNSVVDNIRDLVDVMPALNITGDPTLSALAERLRTLTQYDADVLRTSNKLRTNMAAEAKAIYDSLSEFMA